MDTDAVKAALGIKNAAPNVASKPITLSQMDTFLEIISNPMIQRYLTPILDRVANKAGIQPHGASDQSQPVPPQQVQQSSRPNITINATGMEIYDMFTGFMASIDPKVSIGEFNTWLGKNKEKVVVVFNNALGKGST